MAPREIAGLCGRVRVLARTSPSRTFFRPPRRAATAAISLFHHQGVSRDARRATCDRRLMSEIDLGIGTPAWPALIRHPRKKKR